MIVPNGYNENWQNARIEDLDLDNELAFQPLERQFAHDWENDGNDGFNRNLNEHPWFHLNVEPEPLAGLPWNHPDVLVQLDREAAENEAAQELYEMVNLDMDYTIPGGLGDEDPRIAHVPALSVQHGDQVCSLVDQKHILFHKKSDGNDDECESIVFPEEFIAHKCRFFDADDTLCVMVFAADGVNTLIYSFFDGQVRGGGPMPEAIDWDRDILQKVSLIEGERLQVVVTNDDDENRIIMIGV